LSYDALKLGCCFWWGVQLATVFIWRQVTVMRAELAAQPPQCPHSAFLVTITFAPCIHAELLWYSRFTIFLVTSWAHLDPNLVDCIILAHIHNYGTWADNGDLPTTAQPTNLRETSCRTMNSNDGLQNGVGSVTNPLSLESKATSIIMIHMCVAYQGLGDFQHQ
jgi:hypothetical protein